MNRISKQKRNQLIQAALFFVAVVAVLWFALIRFQQARLQKLTGEKRTAEGKLLQIRDTIKNSKQIEADLLVVSNKLVAQEADMASGDLYSSMVNSIRTFKQQYKVEIPQYNNPGGVAQEMSLLPKFPYKQFTVSISGTAYYNDLGQFIADFENQFPSSRILNLEVTPASAPTPEEKEKLSFKMDIVSLVRPSGATTTAKQ